MGDPTPIPVVEPTPAPAPVVDAPKPVIDALKPTEKSVASAPGQVAIDFDASKLKVPEGMKADDASLGKFADIIKDDKLSAQDRGQKLLDLYSDLRKQVSDGHTKAWEDMNTKWVQETKTALGGDLEATTSSIAKAIDTLGADGARAFREALDITGAGNHPAVVKALAHFSKAFSEGRHVSGNPPKPDQKISQIFYPNSDMKDAS